MTNHTVEIIAPDGDVILLVGTEDKQRLQVSSATLSSISPVFKALLGPHFREGQQPRSSSNPVSISLPDDESDDMNRLCQIAHLKFEEDLESLYCDDILQLAVLVDKYDCSALLQPQSAGILLSWLLNHPPGHVSFTPVSIWRIALAAFLMRSMQAFRDATEKIIVHTTVGPPPSISKSSPCLALNVIVFKVLFSPRFQEGQQPRDSGHPVEIELPEDNSAAMLRLCQMAHFQPVNIVETYFKKNAPRSASELCDIAKVMDKYDRVEPLKLQSTGLLLSWLESPLPSGTDSVDLNSLLFITVASLLMHCAQAFAIVTSRIIFRTTIRINCAPWAELIPLNVIVTLEGTRSAAWQHFCFGLPELGIPKCPEWSNKWDNKDALFMQRLADAFNLPFWPPRMEKGMTLPRLLDRTRDMVAVPRSRPTCSHTHSKTEVSAEAFRKFADQITERSQTLCFGCIRGIHLPGVNCRKHIWSLREGAEIEDS
ncbi:Putative BTB/POZ domain-containing protein [Septoria linicola]|uniref:BTB/POZ domain-containing protein n=1 Tax=Septoria linicola TaxID=215465 RepID=A0A9Q9B1N8_9PEZI|nr:Putative BTB/POZ domain-containing protein [Septoria linicola]